LIDTNEREINDLYKEIKDLRDKTEDADMRDGLSKWFSDSGDEEKTKLNSFLGHIQEARQDALHDSSYEGMLSTKLELNNGTIPLDGIITSIADSVTGELITKSGGDSWNDHVKTGVSAGLSSLGQAGLSSVATSALGKLGISTALGGTAATGALAALGGPVGAAIAVAPILMEVLPMIMKMSDQRSRELSEQIEGTKNERQALTHELQSLLTSMSVNTKESAKNTSVKVKELLDKVQKPNNFGLSTLQGIGLTQELEMLSSSMSTNGLTLTSMQQYSSDVELVSSE